MLRSFHDAAQRDALALAIAAKDSVAPTGNIATVPAANERLEDA